MASVSKVERQINLVICLLSSAQFMTAEQIRASVIGYRESPSGEAFNRMFERDKTELRELGVPLETGRNSAFSETDGYRIRRDAYELPPISLEQDESAAVAMAAALWDTPAMASAARNAVLKLRAGGVDLGSGSQLDVGVHSSAPRSMGSESVVASLLAAVGDGQAVQFGHRSSRTQPVRTRHLEPWGVLTHRGRWYVVGHDTDRNAVRTFRLSRIVEPVEQTGAAATSGTGQDLRAVVAHASAYADAATADPARVWVADGRADGLRRLSSAVEPAAQDGRAGAVLEFNEWSLDSLARMVLGAGPHAVVLEPPALRERVVDDLRSTLTTSTDAI